MEQANNALQNENGTSENTPKTFNVKIWIDANWNPIMQSVTEDELINGYMRQQITQGKLKNLQKKGNSYNDKLKGLTQLMMKMQMWVRFWHLIV